MSRMRMIQYYEVLGLEWGTMPESARDCDALIERTCARILKTEKPDSSAPDLLQSWWTDRRDLILEARSLLGSSATRGKVTQELKRIYAVSVREDPMEPFSVLGIDLLKEADIRRDQKFEGISKEQDARIFEKAKKAYLFLEKKNHEDNFPEGAEKEWHSARSKMINHAFSLISKEDGRRRVYRRLDACRERFLDRQQRKEAQKEETRERRQARNPTMEQFANFLGRAEAAADAASLSLSFAENSMHDGQVWTPVRLSHVRSLYEDAQRKSDALTRIDEMMDAIWEDHPAYRRQCLVYRRLRRRTEHDLARCEALIEEMEAGEPGVRTRKLRRTLLAATAAAACAGAILVIGLRWSRAESTAQRQQYLEEQQQEYMQGFDRTYADRAPGETQVQMP